jgi:UDP-N-acetylmuramate--alanine ligase
MKLENIHSVYFLGIGGIGMSALARWFNHNGKVVSGYDKTQTALTNQLQTEGIQIHFEDDPELITEKVKNSKFNSLIIYTPAIPIDHSEWLWLKANEYEIMKRSEVLGLITSNMKSVAVAGTHGKTTTSSMIVHLLKSAGIDCTGFLGGISTNYNTNMVLNDSADAVAVIEADEFDRSFLTLFPNMAVVTATDADHLDIYGDKDALKDSFRKFVSQIDNNGQLFIKEGLGKDIIAEDASYGHNSYAIQDAAITAENLRIEAATFVFDYKDGTNVIEGIRLNVPGYHNVENMLAAISVTRKFGADDDAIRDGVGSYLGVKRRFEYLIKKDDLVYIDDYAHHPVEIEAFLLSVRSLYNNRKVTAVFQPHLFSRTRDFAEEFSRSLSLADELIMLDIYPARELPIEGITSDSILENVTLDKKLIVSKDDLLDTIKAWKPEVVVTIGAGDIDQFVLPIKNALS